MTTRRYIGANLGLLAICLALIAALFIFSAEKVLIGVLFRGAFGLLVLLNSIYLLVTKHPSFLIQRGRERHRILFGILLLIVGLEMLITAFMGYGINGYPLLR